MDKIDLSKYPRDVQLAAMAVGMDRAAPYKRHGKLWYVPFKVSYYSDGASLDVIDIFDEFVRKGYAEFQEIEKTRYHQDDPVETVHRYTMTRAGLDWLSKALDIHIYDPKPF